MNRRRYPSDLTDKQWAEIKPLVPDAKLGRRARKADKRELVEVIFYVVHAGTEHQGCPSRRSSLSGSRAEPER
jgi:putative transposase